jgi:murein peptide amidase A
MIRNTATNHSIAIHRSFFRDVYRPVTSLKNVSVTTLAQVQYFEHEYPLVCIETISDKSNSPDLPCVLISAGVHGDEPAGVIAAVDFLRDFAPALSDQLRLIVLPCVNPSGYEANTLETMSGINLNRSFGINSSEPEIHAIESWLAESRLTFRITLDLHEAPPYYRGEGFARKDNPTGTYLYETVSDDSTRIGHAMIAALPSRADVCRWPTIYHDKNDAGVVAYPDACRNAIYAEKTSFDAYLNARYTNHSITTETPTFWDFEKRVATQLTYICSALEQICEQWNPVQGDRLRHRTQL